MPARLSWHITFKISLFIILMQCFSNHDQNLFIFNSTLIKPVYRISYSNNKITLKVSSQEVIPVFPNAGADVVGLPKLPNAIFF